MQLRICILIIISVNTKILEFDSKETIIILFNETVWRAGLIGILQERRRVLGDEIDPITLLAPSPIRAWLDYYEHRVESISREYTIIENCDLVCLYALSSCPWLYTRFTKSNFHFQSDNQFIEKR